MSKHELIPSPRTILIICTLFVPNVYSLRTFCEHKTNLNENDVKIIYKYQRNGQPQGAIRINQKEGGNIGKLLIVYVCKQILLKHFLFCLPTRLISKA